MNAAGATAQPGGPDQGPARRLRLTVESFEQDFDDLASIRAAAHALTVAAQELRRAATAAGCPAHDAETLAHATGLAPSVTSLVAAQAPSSDEPAPSADGRSADLAAATDALRAALREATHAVHWCRRLSHPSGECAFEHEIGRRCGWVLAAVHDLT